MKFLLIFYQIKVENRLFTKLHCNKWEIIFLVIVKIANISTQLIFISNLFKIRNSIFHK
jgi:hypothetical protein